jgi:uncharacterized protein with HEPN domain
MGTNEKGDALYVEHILLAIGKIEKYIGDVSFDDFSASDLLVDGVARELGIIGEAANRLSAEFREEHPGIPYAPMIAMRNYLIHEYFGVNEEMIWQTCREDLPSLKNTLLLLKS